jgi:hypothetical protein
MFAGYNAWCNRRLYGAVATLSEGIETMICCQELAGKAGMVTAGCPVPLRVALVVKYGSKMRGRTSAGIPHP